VHRPTAALSIFPSASRAKLDAALSFAVFSPRADTARRAASRAKPHSVAVHVAHLTAHFENSFHSFRSVSMLHLVAENLCGSTHTLYSLKGWKPAAFKRYGSTAFNLYCRPTTGRGP
jgi:hypothetical protein